MRLLFWLLVFGVIGFMWWIVLSIGIERLELMR